MSDHDLQVYSAIISQLNRSRSSVDLGASMTKVIEGLLELLGFSAGALRIKTSFGETEKEIERVVGKVRLCFSDMLAPDCVCGAALESGEMSQGNSNDLPEPTCEEAGFKKVIAFTIPITSFPGGVFLAASKEEVSPPAVCIDLVKRICAHVGETAQRIHETAKDAEFASELATLYSVGGLITSRLNLRDMTREIVACLSSVMETDEVNVILYDKMQMELKFIASYFADGSALDRPETYPLSDGMNSWIINNRKSLLMTYNTQEECLRLGIRHGGAPAKSWLGAPMIYKEKVVGVLSVQSYSKKGLYGERSKTLIEIVAAQCAVAVENARLFEEIIEREKEKEWLYFSLTHDLRSLVNPVAGFAKMLNGASPDEPVAIRDRLLRGIETSSGKLTRFVDDILVYSKLKSGKLALNIARGNIIKCVQSAVILNFPEFSMRKLKVIVNGQEVADNVEIEETQEADFDIAQIERILLNLVSNATKHARSKIEITANSDESEATISIKDDGPGVAEDQTSAIFDEYYQADSKKKGVGLGLPTVKKLVEMHHGSIKVTSKPGQWFCIKFSWPRTLADRG